MTAVQLFSPGALNPILERIKAEVRAIETDIGSEAGRKAIGSLAYKVARTKTFIDDQRKSLVADEKRRLSAVDAEGRLVWDELEALKNEVMAPLTEWRNAETARVKGHEDRILAMSEIAASSFVSIDVVCRTSKRLDGLWDHNFQEFTKRALAAHDKAAWNLKEQEGRILRADAEREQQNRLRAEAEEKARVERETKIAEDARLKAEAEAKRREEANSLAAKQREDELNRIAAEEKSRLERERKESEARLQKSIDDARAKAQRDKLAAEERERIAEIDRKAAAAKVETDRIAAERLAELDRHAAVVAERKRQEDIRKAEDEKRDAIARERKKREADKAHRADIGSAAVNVLVAHGIDAASAVVVIGLIDAGEVPNVSITY